MAGVKHWGVVPAAGAGSRMGGSTPKQYLPLAGGTVLGQTLGRMLDWGFLERIAVALAPGDPQFAGLPVAADARIITVEGGARRSDSVLAALDGLAGLAAPEDWVWVHDAVRPCVARADIASLRNALEGEPVGLVLARPVGSTVKRATEDGRVDQTLERQRLWLAQTPQVFPLGRLREALERANRDEVLVTDESSAVERLGLQPRLVEGWGRNPKITRPGDLALAAGVLEAITRLEGAR